MSDQVDHADGSVIDGLAWSCLDIVSDLHLQASEPANWQAFEGYLRHTPAQALFVLGDLFEVWVGDDVLDDPSGAFEQQVVTALAQAAQRMAVFWIPGNRDFLTGPAFAQACGARVLSDPCVLRLPQENCLLTHGDALCLSDHDYMAFRQKVRDPAWQQGFLSRPLAERQALAKQMREQSQSRQQTLSEFADVDDEAARQWLHQGHARTMIHGHTHRPADHDLGNGLMRRVLSDWCADAAPPRTQIMRWMAPTRLGAEDSWRRLSPCAAASPQK